MSTQGQSPGQSPGQTPGQIPGQILGIADLMDSSGVKFGTSGARGQVVDMSDRVCYAYALAFLQYLAEDQEPGTAAQGQVAIAGDHRPSSPRIMAAVAQAAQDAGFEAINCGMVPSPAIALYGMAHGVPNMMVTGSHIPDDRNGIKFNTEQGEILKQDEEGIRRQEVLIPDGLFDEQGMFTHALALPEASEQAYQEYVRRYTDFYPSDALADMKIGLYGHSGVSRDMMEEILLGLGADVERLGYSEVFIPVDTEAIRPEDVILAKDWAALGKYDALVSFDGDGDRPLVGDEHGNWFRGDVAGVLCARHLNAKCVATPVSSNTLVEKCGWFDSVVRTRIGSPYVVAAMNDQVASGCPSVVGYEANGGFLMDTQIERDGRALSVLPTRDAAIVALALLIMAREQGKPVSALTEGLPARFTYSDRLKNFPTELSQQKIASLNSGDTDADKATIEAMLSTDFGPLESVDSTDGLRMTFVSQEVVHFRPSGNAPELRCYNEAGSEARAVEMNQRCMQILESWRD